MAVKPFEKPLHILIEEKFISLLQSCATLKHLHQIHTQVIAHGMHHSEYVAPRLVSACAQLHHIPLAGRIFHQISHPNIMLCNAMLRGYLQNDLCEDVLRLFGYMKTTAIMPNCFTYPVVLRSCIKISALKEGEQVYSDLTKMGFKSNSYVGTTLIDMYSKCKLTKYAHKVFTEMLEKNVVAWTSMIRGYLSVGNMDSARSLFNLAPERDIVLWNIMISGYIETGDMASAQHLFDRFPNRDVMSWNTMLNGYATWGNIAACEKLFKEMPARNVLSWNGLIGAYVHSGLHSKVLISFKQMLSESDVLPNDATLVTVLSACSKLGALDLGKWVHVYAKNNSLGTNVYIQNALIDMFAKCGVVESALDVFNSMTIKDIISWNSIIGGLAIHGRGIDALKLFTHLTRTKEKPDGITFLGVLCACMHMGLVEDGLSYFQSMVDDYSIVPQIEHYGCMVDLLARSGLVGRALEFIVKMPMEADAVIWAALLGACKIHKNIEVAELALERLVDLEPVNPANYVMLSNVYGDAARWKDVARMKVAVRDTGSKKVPGCSLVEVDDTVAEFFCLDERHSKSEQIYECLRGLTNLLRISGYAPNFGRLNSQPKPHRWHAIIVDNLKKIYPGTDGNPEKPAVKGLSLAIPSGECFGMLGPNGAGKTSFISMMIGLTIPTSGTAYVDQMDIQTEMDSVYTKMGVCPQHDLLWETLTGREHLLFYGRLKNLKGAAALHQAVEESLKELNLLQGGFADKPAGKYSGGMKRRLSVAISLIGDPKKLDSSGSNDQPKAQAK